MPSQNKLLNCVIFLSPFPDSAQSIIPTAVVDNGNTGSDAKDDDDEVQFQIWASNLRSFFENHFFPAFELRRRIDDALDAGRGTSLLN